MKHFFLLVTLLLSLSTCAGELAERALSPEFSSLPPLHVEGTSLAAPDGTPVRLQGVSTHGLAWFPEYVNEACFRQLHDEWNANVIRLALYTAESGGYCTGGDRDALRQLLRDGVRYAANCGMYAIVDWHILSDGDPHLHKDEAKAFFAEMCAEFAEETHVLYEICNEPNGGVGWQRVKAYAEELIPVIRACDPDAVILVGTPTWSQDIDQAAADPITDYDNILYTLHFYAATHTDWLRARLGAALDAGLPVFVSEYGICDASGSGAIDEAQADAWMALLRERGVSCVAWNLSNKNETSALLAPGCSRTSGFSPDDLSASGQWLYATLRGTGAPDPAPPAFIQRDPVPQTPEPAPAPQPGDTGSPSQALTVALSPVNSWPAEGKTATQYTVTITNTAQTACAGWQIELVFDSPFTLVNGWNGSYSVDGQTLRIANLDYNGTIGPGASLSDIGFILLQ